MDLRKMRYFVTVVEEKNYSKAAEKLHISQPSLSNTIIKLEKEIGFPLLERNTRGLHLTESGWIMYERSIDLLRQYDHFIKEMEEVRFTGNGKLSIGLIESAKHWLPKVIRKYKDDFPQVQVNLTEVLSTNLVQETLTNYEAHAVITNQQFKKEGIYSIPLYKEKLILLTHEDHPLANTDRITMHDLKDEPLITSTQGFQTRMDVLHAFEQENVEPTIMYETERLETACSLVEEGLGITIIPENYINSSHIPATKTCYLESEFLERTVYLATLKNRYLPPFIATFFQYINDYFGKNTE